MYQDKGRNISFSKSATPNKFLYNGKEFDTNTGYYQYGFRQYDAVIGRWHSEVSEQVVVDALCEQYYSTSPYAYVSGNPVLYYDILGLSQQQSLQDIIDEIMRKMELNGSEVGSWSSAGGGSYSYYSTLEAAQEAGLIFPYLLPEVEIIPIKGANGQRLDWLTNPASLANAIRVRNDVLYANYRLWQMTPDYLKDDVVDWRDMMWGSSNTDDNPYLPWKPDAIQIEFGVSLHVAGVINYSRGTGIISSSTQTAIHSTYSYTLFPKFDLDLKNLKLISIGPYLTFNMLDNKTKDQQSLDVYKQGGVTTTLGLGTFGLNYGKPAENYDSFRYGPFTPALTGGYNSYGFTINPGFGLYRTPSYTHYWFVFKN